MKQAGKLVLFVLSLLVLETCSKEYSQEGGKYRKCVLCSYLPLCDSSRFVFIDSSAASIDTLSGTVSIGSDTVANGIKYTSVSGFAAFSGNLLYNCDQQDYKVLMPLSTFGLNADSIKAAILQAIPLPIPPGMIQVPSVFRTSILKASLAANAMWTDTVFTFALPPLLNFFAGLEYTILEKNSTRRVYQTDYADVIHVQAKLKTVSTLGNLPFAFTIDYYFSRDVGLIEMKVQSNGTLTNDIRLFQYHI
jgi:hypothetical protein